MVTTNSPDLAISSFHRPAADSSGTLLPPDGVGGATTNRPANIRRQFVSFATIGQLSTIAYLVATALRFVLLRSWIGSRAALNASAAR